MAPVKFSSRSFESGIRHSVQFAHINNPEDFWIKFDEYGIEEYKDFARRLHRIYSQQMNEKSLPPPLKSIDEGDYCVFENGKYYRGVVVAEGRKMVDIVDVDSGEISKLIPVKRVFPVLNDDIVRQTPAFAFWCKLPSIGPPAAREWTEEDVDAFMNNYCDRKLTCEFLGMDGDKNVVNLFMKNGREVADHMYGIGLARRKRQVVVEPPLTYPSLEIDAKLGDRVHVIVSFVESPTKIFVQLASNEKLISQMSRELNHEYTKNSEKYGGVVPARGRCCIAQYETDLHWYRAVITGRPSPTVLEVFFVDYGNSARVPVNRVKELAPCVSFYPMQAVQCRLTGIQDNAAFTRLLQQKVESKNMILRIDNLDNDSLSVTMFQVVGHRENNINEYFLGRGGPVLWSPPPSLPPRPSSNRLTYTRRFCD